jgi:hypothetical protein
VKVIDILQEVTICLRGCPSLHYPKRIEVTSQLFDLLEKLHRQEADVYPTYLALRELIAEQRKEAVREDGHEAAFWREVLEHVPTR